MNILVVLPTGDAKVNVFDGSLAKSRWVTVHWESYKQAVIEVIGEADCDPYIRYVSPTVAEVHFSVLGSAYLPCEILIC
jgi:hypothetical protein